MKKSLGRGDKAVMCVSPGHCWLQGSTEPTSEPCRGRASLLLHEGWKGWDWKTVLPAGHQRQHGLLSPMKGNDARFILTWELGVFSLCCIPAVTVIYLKYKNKPMAALQPSQRVKSNDTNLSKAISTHWLLAPTSPPCIPIATATAGLSALCISLHQMDVGSIFAKVSY